MNVVALVLAVVCATVAAMLGFGLFDGAHLLGWLSLAVALVALAMLVPAAVAIVHRQP